MIYLVEIMQFNNPNILYALFALIIPILVHLFQLRKFQKTEFTNVKFLKELIIQTRKSSQLKKWLILTLRLLIFIAIIFAFSEPYLDTNNNIKQNAENVFYIDNSFSMQEKGAKGELMRVAIQDLIDNYPNDKKISIITNTKTFKDKTLNELKKELINLTYTHNQLDYKTLNLKTNLLFNTKTNNLKKVIYISDFQKNKTLDSSYFSTEYQTTLIQTLPITKNNISIDSAYFSDQNATSSLLNVIVSKQHSSLSNIPITLYNNDSIISKTTINFNNSKASTSFNVSSKDNLNLKIELIDAKNSYDNILYLSKSKPTKQKILAIGSIENNAFLEKIYTKEEFTLTQNTSKSINYSVFEQQHLIVLNELETIPVALIKNLSEFSKKGGTVLCIPSEIIDSSSYNMFKNVYDIENEFETRLTKIHFSHPIFSRVFEKKIKNFQYPSFKKHFKLKNYQSTILSLENGNPLLVHSNNYYFFSAPLNTKNSNFKQAPLIVPTLYNIAKSTLKLGIPYYLIGKDNTIDIPLNLDKDDVLTLENKTSSFIPMQQIKGNKVSVQTNTKPSQAGFYTIKNKQEALPIKLAYNYCRNESIMDYHKVALLENKYIKTDTSVTNTLNEINSASQIGTLWKWFVIFAILFLLVELLILKYFK